MNADKILNAVTSRLGSHIGVNRRLSAANLSRAVAVIAVTASACLPWPVVQAQQKPVAVGQQAPDFTLTDQNGRKHSLSAERGKRAGVLVFYRGYW